ncbi:FAD-dependent monooxygenase [Nonomuraea sp. NEAU-A123]|uniref:FAD-dependent monooxygenase n=1 Tax=Nonomuraea sp. NEAU-A123 TaxID=2839649 RepID=UPI001BE4A112|nr:FAD-dependent monooxygenase [Nonomuraea sp. NEAU-A123]MBT2227596.1 FAD-dependent monooxygenase [Nonomuraea sp. NEAU-A123]
MNADVVVVGAGPVGLLLAAELRLAGATPLVLDRLAEPTSEPKARGIGPLAAEALRRRGLGEAVAKFHEQGLADKARDHGSEKGHFAQIHKIDPDLQEEPERAGALIWQPDLERILAEHLASLGVPIWREHEVTALTQDDSGVTVTVRTPAGERHLSAAYVAGCDGGRSTVRKLARFDFPGTAPTSVVRRLRGDISGMERLPESGWQPTGMLMCAPGMVATVEVDGFPEDRDAPLTGEEMRDSLLRVTGVEVEVTAVHDTLRFTDGARQAATYRLGRVLLAGDAAHVHSPNGGQGLNLGLMDAVNLGWKLAATVAGRAPDGLLDTYTAERHPVGAAVLHNTRAQSALLRPGAHAAAMRDIVSDLLDLPEANRYFGRLLNGLGTRYDLPYPASHPLAGRPCPDLRLTLSSGTRRTLADLAASGRPLLVHAASRPEVAEAAAAWRGSLDIAEATVEDRDDLSAAFIRPDGTVAWASTPGPADTTTLTAALHAWLSPA